MKCTEDLPKKFKFVTIYKLQKKTKYQNETVVVYFPSPTTLGYSRSTTVKENTN